MLFAFITWKFFCSFLHFETRKRAPIHLFPHTLTLPPIYLRSHLLLHSKNMPEFILIVQQSENNCNNFWWRFVTTRKFTFDHLSRWQLCRWLMSSSMQQKSTKKSIHMVILRNFKSFDLHTRDQIKVKFMAMFVWYENFSLTVYFSNSPQNGNFTTPQVKGKAEQKREKLIFHQSQNGWMILKIFGAKTIENRCAGGSSLNRLHGQK